MITWTLRVCAIIFSLTMFYASWHGFVENRRFETQGQKILVEPLEKYTETTTIKTRIGMQVSESKSNSAEIVFTTLDRRRIRVNRIIPDEVLTAFRSGSEVYMEYLPEAPTESRFVGHGARPFVSASIGLLGAALTWLLWRKM